MSQHMLMKSICAGGGGDQGGGRKEVVLSSCVLFSTYVSLEAAVCVWRNQHEDNCGVICSGSCALITSMGIFSLFIPLPLFLEE